MEGPSPSEPLVSSLMEQHHHLLHLGSYLRCATGGMKSQGAGLHIFRPDLLSWDGVSEKKQVGGLLLPGAPPGPRLSLMQQQRAPQSYRWHL